MNCGEEKGQQCAAGKVVGYDAAARVKFPITFVRNGLQWRTYLAYKDHQLLARYIHIFIPIVGF